MNKAILSIACIISSVVSTAGTLTYDDKYILSKDYDYYLQRTKSNAAKNCPVNEMAAYGLTADITSQGDPNPICPQIQGNCCGPKDQELINTYWTTDDRHQAGFNIAYLSINKYILGNVKNYLNIAADIVEKSARMRFQGGANRPNQGGSGGNAQTVDDDKPYTFTYHPLCEEAAKKFTQLDFVDRNKVQHFYDSLNKRANFLQDARRGFYCTLCNARAKDYISTFRIGIDSRLWYSRDFCEVLFTNAFTAVYQMYKAYNPFIKSLMHMMMCIQPKNKSGAQGNNAQGNNGNSGNNGLNMNVNVNVGMGANVNLGAGAGASVTYNPLSMSVDLKAKNPFTDKRLPEAVRKLLENPLHITSKFGLEFCWNSDPTGVFFSIKCMSFCEHFHITRADTLLDGDLDSIKAVYHALLEYEFALESPNTSVFGNDVVRLKRTIQTEISYLKSNYNFYRSLDSRINFSEYKTVFSLIFKGHNPMALSHGTTLAFKYKAAHLLRALAAIAAALFLSI